jgi:hypothetical protein
MKAPAEIADRTLESLQASGCCTLCSRAISSGAGNQIADAAGRMHRHCDRCHAGAMDSPGWLMGASLPGVALQMASSTPQNGPKLAVSGTPRSCDPGIAIREGGDPQNFANFEGSPMKALAILLAPVALLLIRAAVGVLA